MATTKMFVHYNGTVEDFKKLSNLSDYNNKIVFIKGGNTGKGAAIYTHGSYFANFAEFLAAVNFVKGVNVNGQNYNAAVGGGYLAFNASDPATVAVNAGQNGISIGLTKDFVDRVSAVETLAGNTSTALGAKGDAANAEGSAFARIAQLASAVAGLQGTGTGSVSDQITAAVNALKGTLDTNDAKTLAAINDELDAIDDKWASYVSKAELAAIGDNKADGDKVNVKVTTLGGKVTAVEVDETGLTNALNLKANAADVYTKGDADTMAQGKVDALANSTVKANTDAIAKLNGNTSVEGSVDKKIQDAINAFAGSADGDNVIDNVTELLAYVSKVDGSKDLSLAIADIAANKAAIATLKGNNTTAGSVAKAIADEVARAEAAYAVKGTEGVASGAAARAEEAYALAGEKATAAEAKAQAVAAIGEIAEVTKEDTDNAYVKVTVKTKAGSVSSVEVDDAGVKAYADSLSSNYDPAGAAAAVLGTAADTADKATVYGAKAYADLLFAWEEL
jgi:hypothetical protein